MFSPLGDLLLSCIPYVIVRFTPHATILKIGGFPEQREWPENVKGPSALLILPIEPTAVESITVGETPDRKQYARRWSGVEARAPSPQAIYWWRCGPDIPQHARGIPSEKSPPLAGPDVKLNFTKSFQSPEQKVRSSQEVQFSDKAVQASRLYRKSGT
ncbi:hypothetical protein OE88DRAFT_1648194 [Heliocybe sulcata]|uniref:Uncharacterized protein n=1 Tax=Heliocybe sulcata TaxID=5364 RepID=A0A5C3MNF3_9AGAM|nr:hypothetical protein OE88DRAFT_1648194 [Heliocybe sulcata]